MLWGPYSPQEECRLRQSASHCSPATESSFTGVNHDTNDVLFAERCAEIGGYISEAAPWLEPYAMALGELLCCSLLGDAPAQSWTGPCSESMHGDAARSEVRDAVLPSPPTTGSVESVAHWHYEGWRRQRTRLFNLACSWTEVTKTTSNWQLSRVAELQRVGRIMIPNDVLLFTTLVGGWSLPLDLDSDPMENWYFDQRHWVYVATHREDCTATGHWPLGSWKLLVEPTLRQFRAEGADVPDSESDEVEAFLGVDGPQRGRVTFRPVRRGPLVVQSVLKNA